MSRLNHITEKEKSLSCIAFLVPNGVKFIPGTAIHSFHKLDLFLANSYGRALPQFENIHTTSEEKTIRSNSKGFVIIEFLGSLDSCAIELIGLRQYTADSDRILSTHQNRRNKAHVL